MATTLHVHCGDSSAEALRRGLPRAEVVVWADILFDGPCPAGVEGAAWRELRAAFLSASTGGVKDVPGCRGWLERQDLALETASSHDETVLWFDACLYDQLLLIRLLALLGPSLENRRLSLICVGAFPGFAKFRGLGELSPEQFASLLDTRHEVSLPELDEARRAWDAFRSDTPAALESFIASTSGALPFLKDALLRHLENYPSAANGLGRLEQAALEVVGEGRSTLPDIFAAVSDREARPYFGDTTLWACLDYLSRAARPALVVDGPDLPLWAPPRDLSPWRVGLTEVGRGLLANSLDWVELNGIDRWLGGVHLEGRGPLWRRKSSLSGWQSRPEGAIGSPCAFTLEIC